VFRPIDVEFRPIHVLFRLQGDEFASASALSRAIPDRFAAKACLYVSIVCRECPKEAHDRDIESQFSAIPGLYACFVVVDARKAEAFLAQLVRYVSKPAVDPNIQD
jgi:hypothetical protein